MKTLLAPLAATLVLAACAWTTTPSKDEPYEERTQQVGSHIPVKDRSAGKAVTSGDADAMMRNQRAQTAGANNGK